MTFAKWVFIGAGIWGIVVLAPLYWLVDITGRHYAVPTEYPQFFYGFVSVAMAWQIAFLVIGSSPARFRRLMVPAVIEKLGWVTILAVLFWCGRISSADAQSAVPDLLLGILFIASLLTTRFDSTSAAATTWAASTPQSVASSVSTKPGDSSR